MKTVIIGGIAGGLSAASQIRREDPAAQVIVLEKSGDVSYAACGMPYNLFYKNKRVIRRSILPSVIRCLLQRTGQSRKFK